MEPEYAISYTRKTVGLTNNVESYYKVYCKAAREYMKINNITEEDLPEYFIGSSKVDPIARVKMQAAMQKHIDTAISSTVNLPETATKELMEHIYLTAWKMGLKGITIFRDNCKKVGVLTTSNPADKKEDNKDIELPRGAIIECSDNLIGMKRKLQTGCVDSETEFFNGKQWKKISDYQEGDLVLQYNIDGSAELVRPLQYIKRKSEGQYHIKTKYGLDMMVSPDHRNVVFGYRDKLEIIDTKTLVEKHENNKLGFCKKFKKSFEFVGGSGIDLTDDEIRIQVAIFADGCYYSPTSKKCLISVSKKRKRDRLIELLISAGIEYSEYCDSDGFYNIKFYPPLQNREKCFPSEWYNCTRHQLRVIFDEVFLWDGRYETKNEYTTIIKSNADFIQFVCSALGYRGSIYKDNRHSTVCYRVDWSDRNFACVLRKGINKLKIEFCNPSDGYDYCFSVPSTMLVLRRNDNIFITGNCGSLHVTGFFDEETGKLMEVYLSKGSTGGCNNFMIGLSRMISLLCRAGVDIATIKDQLDSTGACPSYATRSAMKHDTSRGSCCPMAVGNALLDMYNEFNKKFVDYDDEDITPKSEESNHKENKEEKYGKMTCPVCGSKLIAENGCVNCKNCGWQKC